MAIGAAFVYPPPVMSQAVLFYISGHGYGHARRSAQVIKALRQLDPSIAVYVRTTASPTLFTDVLPAERVTRSEVDAGAAEHSPLEIDAAGTLDLIEAALARQPRVVAEELAYIERVRPRLIVSDIPFLAGAIAEAAQIPCVGMSNFTWDWIVEPFVQRLQRSKSAAEAIHHQYSKMTAILRLPLGGISGAFPQVIDVPLVANLSRRDSADVLRRLGIDPHDDRRRVLFGMRGAVPTATLAAVAASASDLMLICPADKPGDVPPGVVPAPIGAGLDFSDVLQACDVVVGKMGYGLNAECIVSGVALLWTRRTGFREDEVMERDGPQVMRMRELPLVDFHAGRWAEHIRAAANLSKPPVVMRADGAEVCAKWIARVLSEKC